ncbi:hypothetical protein [Nitrobacter sp.]|uniref:hypothetical protein n=1 Tax=Nitrobacter sp. TaxID=29420 RepID=UPI001D63C8B6|nr:hypothetical protein [Nitrobacter sp.]MCB1392463.1 hypothetical protein [Nitrobacter sp.]
MVPGGITEIIWHFAGYLKIFDDIARSREAPDEGSYRSQVEDYTTHRPHFEFTPTDEEMDTRPTPIQNSPTIGGGGGFAPHSHSHPTPEDGPDRFGPPHSAGFLPPINAGGSGAAGGGVEVIKVAYHETGAQSEIQTHQFNVMHDNDSLVGTQDANLLVALNADADHAISQMLAGADAAVPADWHAPQNTAALPAFVAEHDQAWADRGGAADAHSVQSGYYVNGLLQDRPADVPAADPAPEADLGKGPGQWALDGGNTASNGAYIIDLTNSARTMVVAGDYYKTNAIVQTNSYMDNDHVTVGGSEANVTTGGNQATNIADFIEHPGVYESLPSYTSSNWSVDVVKGDYFNIRALVQTNYLSDNDVTMQNSSSTHFEVHAGQNELGNFVLINDGDFNYDLIVVGGSYHGMNVIYQNNILYNNDTVKITGDGVDPNQSVSTGDNQLTNTATIESYGGSNALAWNSGLDDLIHNISGGVTELDPSFAELIAGNGGKLNILYITGDYYDVNAIWQTNVVSDANLAIQLQGSPSAVTAGYYGDSMITQNVATGGNVLSNDAAIVDVGSTNLHVGGQIYGDSILIQANLVEENSDHVTQTDPQALVPEVIAFVGSDDAPINSDSHQPAPAPIPHDDPMANVLH